MAVTKTKVLEIMLVSHLKGFQPCNIHASHLMDEIGLLQRTEIVDNLQWRDVDTLGLEITTDVIGREKIPYIVCGIEYKTLQEIHVADTLALDNVL